MNVWTNFHGNWLNIFSRGCLLAALPPSLSALPKEPRDTALCWCVYWGNHSCISSIAVCFKKNPPSRKPQAQPLNIQLRNTSLVATVHTVLHILCIITYRSLICINITQMFSWATMNWLFCELLSKIPWHHLHFRNPLRGKLRCRRRRAHLTLANLFIHGTTGRPTHVGPVFKNYDRNSSTVFVTVVLSPSPCQLRSPWPEICWRPLLWVLVLPHKSITLSHSLSMYARLLWQ